MFSRVISLGVSCTLAGFVLVSLAVAAEEPGAARATTEQILTLEEALQRTLATGPDLTVATEELRAIEAEALLAGRLPNPELSVVLENVAGDGAYQDTDAAELTIELSQPLELGGKRRLRREAAELGRQLATNGQTLARAETLSMTRQRFIHVLAAQDGLALAKEQAELAEKSLAAAEERFKAGKAPLIDRLRLQGEASLSRMAAVQAERRLLTARQLLAASWGDAQPGFDRVAGELAVLPPAPELGAVEATLEQSAEAASRRIVAQLRENDLAQAKARQIPDPSLSVGWRQFEESNEEAWLFGIAIPLPLFSQGRDEVAAASSRFNGAKAREVKARTEARSTLRAAWQALADARAEAEVLGGQVVPAAEAGFAAADFGYRSGKFGLLELLDAQRALFEVRQQQLAARTACHLAAIELQRLQGTDTGAATPSRHPF